MKIGIVCPYNISKGGGVQEHVLAQAAGLSKRGHKVLIITPRPRGQIGSEPKNIRFLGRAADIKSPFHTTGQVSVTPDIDEIDKLLETEKFDILHFHEPWVPMLSRQLLSRSKAVNIATFHAKLPDGIMSRTIEKAITPYTKSIVKYLDVLTAVSETAAEYIHTLTNKPVTIIPNGIDLSKYKTNNYSSKVQTSKSTKQILYIGRLEKRKGVKYLLQAFALLTGQDPELELIIAGDGSDRPKLELFVHDNHISNVTFLGFVDEITKLRLLKSASVFCSPALYGESFGIVLLEAMAVGLPVVAGNNAGYVSVLKGLGAISIINPKDTSELARRLEIMAGNDDLRKLWQKWAEEYVQQFDYSKIISQYEDLYKRAKAR
jgi:phosphatidylinositol alpha-mannosyltransferase